MAEHLKLIFQVCMPQLVTAYDSDTYRPCSMDKVSGRSEGPHSILVRSIPIGVISSPQIAVSWAIRRCDLAKSVSHCSTDRKSTQMTLLLTTPWRRYPHISRGYDGSLHPMHKPVPPGKIPVSLDWKSVVYWSMTTGAHRMRFC